jgi:hypothetical protein
MSRSTAVLVAANLLPFAGVLWLDWPVNEVLLLYWFELIVIGVIGAARLLICIVTNEDLGIASKAAGILVGTPVFASILGVWCFMYGFFVVRIFFPPPAAGSGLFDPVPSALVREPTLVLVAAGLALSHVHRFVRDFLLAQEYRKLTPESCVGWSLLQILPMTAGFILAIATIVFSQGVQVYAVGVFALIKVLVELSLLSQSRVWRAK